MARVQHLLLCQAGSRKSLQQPVVPVVEELLHCDQRESGDGEEDLEALHAELVRAWWLLPPLRGRTTAQAADLREHYEIQQGADDGEDDHRDAERIGVEALHHGACSRTEDQRAEADGEAETICRSKESADALQNSEEETRPGDGALNAARTSGRIFSRREGPDWCRRHESTSAEQNCAQPILHIHDWHRQPSKAGAGIKKGRPALPPRRGTAAREAVSAWIR